MSKTVSTQQLKSHLGTIVDGVSQQGDHYVIQRRGKPVAAMVPLAVHEAYESNRSRLFALMESVAQRNSGQDPEDIEVAIQQAVASVREARASEKR